jgi:hypothetical protein
MMSKTYVLSLTIVTILTLFFALPGVALIGSIFTLGLAIPVIFILPYACLGLWTMLPAAVLWETRARLLFVVLGFGACFVVFALPPWLANNALSADLATRNEIAATPVTLSASIGVELHRPANSNPDLYVIGDGYAGRLIGKAPCDDFCEQLLNGGQIAWLRVVLFNDGINVSHGQTSTDEEVTSHAFLVLGDAATCASVNPDISSGSCVLYAQDDGAQADLLISLDEGYETRAFDQWDIYRPIGYRTARVFMGPDEMAPEVYRATQLFHLRPNGQIMINSGALGIADGGGGIILGRNRIASEPIDLVGALETLGTSVGRAQVPPLKAPGTEFNMFIAPPPDAYDAALVASLIATGPSEGSTFTFSFAQVINGWHDGLRWKPMLTEADRSIFCETLLAQSIPNLFWVDQVIEKHTIECN